MKIKKNDNIIVISGKDKGKTGKVSKVFPKLSMVLIPGLNMKKKHQRGGKGAKKGQILDLAYPVHISNVMIDVAGKRSRVGYKTTGDKKVRISKKNGKEI